MCKELAAELENGRNLAIALAEHLEHMDGASRAEMPFRYKDRAYLVTIEVCSKGCDMQEPYGWVAEAGCPVHDKPLSCCGHDSDCAVHNAPALASGPCDCSKAQ